MVAMILEYVLTQYSSNQVLAKYGTIMPLDPSIWSHEEKKNGIASLIFLTKKRDGMLKKRQCADGKKQ